MASIRCDHSCPETSSTADLPVVRFTIRHRLGVALCQRLDLEHHLATHHEADRFDRKSFAVNAAKPTRRPRLRSQRSCRHLPVMCFQIEVVPFGTAVAF
jgi:hypothetical protein